MPARSDTQHDIFDPKSVRCIGIIPAMHKRRIAAAVQRLILWLEERDIEAALPTEQAEALSLPDLGADIDDVGDRADLLLSMGGDGTFLATARIAAPRGKPLLGINLGGFGFLASIPSGAEMLDTLAQALNAKQAIHPRMMLEAKVVRKGKADQRFLALNDIVVGKGAFSRLFRLKTSISGDPISYFPADGMIVATPTGSTGYSLSAGGPVVDPQVRVIILTPICAHTLSARTLVLPADRVIEMTLPDMRGEEVNLTADGQEGFALHAGDRVEVREAPFSARVVALEDAGFYARLRGKLGWGTHRS
jgi:NAD+ kinase